MHLSVWLLGKRKGFLFFFKGQIGGFLCSFCATKMMIFIFSFPFSVYDVRIYIGEVLPFFFLLRGGTSVKLQISESQVCLSSVFFFLVIKTMGDKCRPI